MIWAESIHLYPLVFLLMSAAFRNMDTSLEEAALTAGSSTFTTFQEGYSAADATRHVQRAFGHIHSWDRSLRSPGLGRRACQDLGLYDQDLSCHSSIPVGFRLGRRLCGDLAADQHHRGADLRKNHAQGGTLRYGDGQGLSTAGDRLGWMEILDLRDFLPDISPRRGFSSLCSFVVFVHSLLRRALSRAHGQNDLGQLSLYFELSVGVNRV